MSSGRDGDGRKYSTYDAEELRAAHLEKYTDNDGNVSYRKISSENRVSKDFSPANSVRMLTQDQLREMTSENPWLAGMTQEQYYTQLFGGGRIVPSTNPAIDRTQYFVPASGDINKTTGRSASWNPADTSFFGMPGYMAPLAVLGSGLLAGGLGGVTGATGVGEGAAAAGGAATVGAEGLTEAQIAEIVAAEGGYSALPSAGMYAPAAASPLANLVPAAKTAIPGTYQISNAASDMFSLKNLATVAGVGAGVAGLAGAASGKLGGGSTTTVSNSTPPASAEELELIRLNAELAKRQLASIDQLQPFQKALLDASMSDIAQQKAMSDAMNAAVTPEQHAALAKQQYDYAMQAGPIQQELLQKQLDIIKRNGAATPEQEALIKSAADSAITAGTGDINTQTKRGIQMIADELANARGLRLSDTPIGTEAALLTRAGNDQISSLTNNIRASQAQSTLNYPLAVNQLQSSIVQGQQTTAQAAQQFQADLQARAAANRLALTGQSSSTGIGLANTGNSSSALNTMLQARLNSGSRTTDTTNGIGLTQIGQLASGIGGLLTATSRL